MVLDSKIAKKVTLMEGAQNTSSLDFQGCEKCTTEKTHTIYNNGKERTFCEDCYEKYKSAWHNC